MNHAIAKRFAGVYKDGFTRLEKVFMRTGFYGFVFVGTTAMALQHPALGVVYLVSSVAGLLWVIYGLLCRYCPYPFHYSDCLFFPYQWLTAIKRPPTRRMGRLHQYGFILVMTLLLLIPQPWLLGAPTLMWAFWLLAGPTLAALPFYYCRRCMHRQCKLNRCGAAIRDR